MFHEGDLQSGIALAVQEGKTVLCFVKDESQLSRQWEDVLLSNAEVSQALKDKAVALRLDAGSQEAGFLSSFCPLGGTPTIVLVKHGRVLEQLQSEGSVAVTLEQLVSRLLITLADGAPTLPYQPHETRNATETAPTSSITPVYAQPVPESATTVTSTMPLHQETPGSDNLHGNMRSPIRGHVDQDVSPATTPQAQRTPTNPSTRLEPPTNTQTQAQQTLRADYIKLQKDREQKQRDERERIKQQIKSDREERRRREELRKQPPMVDDATSDVTTLPSTSLQPSNIRVQVRTFDGSTLRNIFPRSASINSDLRPWIDSSSSQSLPYSLKLILTPLPNRNIEAAEEEQSLPDLGIKGSCTLVMVPVKGYVESYTGSTTGGLVGSAVSGGYNIVTGTAGAVFGGVRSFLGWNGQQNPDDGNAGMTGSGDQDRSGPSPSQNVRVRTLADQRAEGSKKDHQFYNGNQLNFEPRKDEGKDD